MSKYFKRLCSLNKNKEMLPLCRQDTKKSALQSTARNKGTHLAAVTAPMTARDAATGFSFLSFHEEGSNNAEKEASGTIIKNTV